MIQSTSMHLQHLDVLACFQPFSTRANARILFCWFRRESLSLPMRSLHVLLAALLVLLYVRCHLQANPRFEVLQLTLPQLQLKHLLEKSPILVTERVVNAMSLLPTAFKYLYTFSDLAIGVNVGRGTNAAQYMMLAATEDGIVCVHHPNAQAYEPLDMVIKRHQVLVLPRLWGYDVRRGTFHVVQLDTLLSRFMRPKPKAVV